MNMAEYARWRVHRGTIHCTMKMMQSTPVAFSFMYCYYLLIAKYITTLLFR